jgi:UPF0755 protein
MRHYHQHAYGKTVRRVSRRWLLLALPLLALGAAAIAVVAGPALAPGRAHGRTVHRTRQPRRATVAQAWVDAGVQTSPGCCTSGFAGRARRGASGRQLCGRSRHHAARLLDKMVQGEKRWNNVRFIEGWTLRQLRAALAKAPHLKPTTAGLSEPQLMALGAPACRPKGASFPTPMPTAGASATSRCCGVPTAPCSSAWPQAWAERAPDSPLKSADEALMLASIVEKETGQAADRGLVAGVFVNRLRIGMPLQTDPTVIYGLGEASTATCASATCWPTRPTTPTRARPAAHADRAARPGFAAAAVRPAADQGAVLRGAGRRQQRLQRNLADHNRAVNTYQRAGR